jgi:hypothetical protein
MIFQKEIQFWAYLFIYFFIYLSIYLFLANFGPFDNISISHDGTNFSSMLMGTGKVELFQQFFNYIVPSLLFVNVQNNMEFTQNDTASNHIELWYSHNCFLGNMFMLVPT